MVPPTSGVSLTGAFAVLASAGVNVSVKTLSRNLEKECQKHTPYGYLITSLDLPLDGGGSYSWKICNPFALLYLLLSQSSAFEALAREHLRGTKAKIPSMLMKPSLAMCCIQNCREKLSVSIGRSLAFRCGSTQELTPGCLLGT